ncbi:hypothetical protein Goari_000635, partial [Gossypium aridum]|nr:hypothetical protein [Gossypium aridum]
WKTKVITKVFNEVKANAILNIPLARNLQDDCQVWSGESTWDYTVRSAYRRLIQGELNQVIWFVRNKALNEGIHQKAWETMQFTQKYLGAWERANTLLPGQRVEREHWRLLEGSIIKINFDEVFNSQSQLSGSSIISRNSKVMCLGTRI